MTTEHGPIENEGARAAQSSSRPERSPTSESSLSETRRRLEAQIDALRASAADGSAGISFGKRIGEGTSLAVERLKDVAVHDRLVEQLALVERAERKESEGTDGICDLCEQPIEDDRRAALAWSVHCVSCAARAPRQTPDAAAGPASSAPPSAGTTSPALERSRSDSPWHQALGSELPSSRD